MENKSVHFTQSNNRIRRDIVDTFEGKGWSYYGVYITILSHMNNNDTYTWPSMDTIANETNFSRRYIVDAVKALEENDFLGIVSYNYHGMPKNRYYFPQEAFFNEAEFQEAGGIHKTHIKGG